MESTKQQPQQQQQQQQQFTSSAGSQNDIGQSLSRFARGLRRLGRSESPTLPTVIDDSLLKSKRLIGEEDHVLSEQRTLAAKFAMLTQRAAVAMFIGPTIAAVAKSTKPTTVAHVATTAQRFFECGICMEEMPDDSIARPDPCGHDFCRDCLRGHVTARIDEHRFPILCPTCTAGSKGKGKAAGGKW